MALQIDYLRPWAAKLMIRSLLPVARICRRRSASLSNAAKIWKTVRTAGSWLKPGRADRRRYDSRRHQQTTTYALRSLNIAWRSDNDGLAQRWWREAILHDPFLNPLTANG
jgi:hypothetical protein